MVLQPVNTALWENYAVQVKLSDKKLMWRRNIGPRTLSSVDTQHLQLATSVIAVLLKISTKFKNAPELFNYKIAEDR